jgi:hypothetical protein
MTDVYAAPSRAKLRLRKIRGAELIMLSTARETGTTEGLAGFSGVLSSCHEETVDPGPYRFVEVGAAKPEWARLLKGDVLGLFIHLRAISMPDREMYGFPVQCSKCRDRYDWEIDLKRDLVVQELPDHSFQALRDGKPLEHKLSDGTGLRFHLQTVSQEVEIAEFLKKEKRATETIIDGLAAQAYSIDGCAADLRARWRRIAQLEMDELLELREVFDAADCGTDTAIQTRCPRKTCGWIEDVTLPLDRRFFASTRRWTAKKEAASGDDSSESPDAG